MTIESTIAGLIARIAWDHDHHAGRGVANFFTDEGIYYPPTGEPIHGKAAIAHFFNSRDLGDRIARHIFTNVAILEASEFEIQAASIMTVYAGNGPGPHPATPSVVLDCSDSFERINGDWLIKYRRLNIVFRTTK